jgi:ribonuclease P protein component
VISTIPSRGVLRDATRSGTRIPGSVLWCTWCPDPEASSTSVAYAIGRAYGSAVRRNRLRRRLRALLAEADRRTPLPPGVMLIGPHRRVVNELTFDQVAADIGKILDRIRSEVSSGRPPSETSPASCNG